MRETPVWIAIRETTVGGDFIHVVVAEHFEHDGEKVQTRVARDFFDLVLFVSQ